MGTISSSVGLVSGLDISALVSQLIQLEAQPLRLLENRIVTAQTQQAAYDALRVSFQASQGAIDRLAKRSSFDVKTATSSNPDVITASATTSAAISNYSFQVKSLVSAQQLISKTGYATADSTAVGAGTLSFLNKGARVNPDTLLSTLNDGQGVQRGTLRITDSSGQTADVSLKYALTASDVLDAINDAAGISVSASVSGDGFVVTDEAGGTGSLIIQDIQDSTAAFDLGIVGSSATGVITGNDILDLSSSTLLKSLNDGRGLRYNGPTEDDLRVTLSNGRIFDLDFSASANVDTSLAEVNGGQGVGEGTIRITNRLGESLDLVLTGEETFAEINAMIVDQSPDFGVRISSVSGTGGIIFSDSTEGQVGPLSIEDVEGTVAQLLDIDKETKDNETTLAGKANYSFTTLGALIRKFEVARDADGTTNGGDFSIELVGNALRIIDNTGTSGQIESLNESQVITDLGFDAGFAGNSSLTSRDLIAGLNTVLLGSLNGGQGFNLGSATFTLRDGSSSGSIDFSSATSLQDVIDLVNGVNGLSAKAGDNGTGITITDSTIGTGTLSISGGGLDEFNLASTSSGKLQSSSLNRQSIFENTLLSDLNGKTGIKYGSLQITDSAGVVQTIVLSQGVHKTVGDVIKSLNDAELGITARISDDGSGITLEDTAGGTGKLAVSELDNAGTAESLGILGEAEDGVLAGSLAGKIDISASDSLQDVADKINEANAGLQASVINDGSGNNSYKLVLTSKTAGSDGEYVYASTGTTLSFGTLSEAKDALLVVGDPSSPNSVLISSSSNTISNAVNGVTLNLIGTSDSPVSVSIDRDTESVVKDVQNFVDTMNATLTRIDELTSFDPDTQQRGALFSEAAVRTLQARVFRMIGSNNDDPGSNLRTLNQLGIFIDSSGGKGARLTMQRTLSNGTVIDGEARLRELLESDPEVVKDFFAKTKVVEEGGEDVLVNVGFASRFKVELDGITNGFDGTLHSESQRIQERIDLFQDRAARLQELLDRKEERLYKEFQTMESALAGLQTQQTALGSLAALASAGQG